MFFPLHWIGDRQTSGAIVYLWLRLDMNQLHWHLERYLRLSDFALHGDAGQNGHFSPQRISHRPRRINLRIEMSPSQPHLTTDSGRLNELLFP